MRPDKESICCNADVKIAGDCKERGHVPCDSLHTIHSVCTKCNKPCDVKYIV